MKSKSFLISLLCALLFLSMPMQRASAATIMYWSNYIAGLDQYRIDYTYPTGSATYMIHYDSGSGYTHDKSWDHAPTGILYLTCNGWYDVHFYDASGAEIGYFTHIPTTQMVHPLCDSYPNSSGMDELNVNIQDAGNGQYQMNWDQAPSGGHSEVYKDGSVVYNGSVPSLKTGAGHYTIINYDSSGNITGRTDTVAPSNYVAPGGSSGTGESNSGGSGGDSGSTECADLICKCISDLKPVLNQINDKTDNQLLKMDDLIAAVNAVKSSVDSVKTSVDNVKTSVDRVWSELHPDQPYSPNSSSDYSVPNLEDNKPPVNPAGKFEDHNTYFTDQGDAEEPDSFPVAPEPSSEWSDANGNVIKQQDQLTRDQPLERDPVKQRDAVNQRDPVLNRDDPLQQDQSDYDLRWESSMYHK